MRVRHEAGRQASGRGPGGRPHTGRRAVAGRRPSAPVAGPDGGADRPVGAAAAPGDVANPRHVGSPSPAVLRRVHGPFGGQAGRRLHTASAEGRGVAAGRGPARLHHHRSPLSRSRGGGGAGRQSHAAGLSTRLPAGADRPGSQRSRDPGRLRGPGPSGRLPGADRAARLAADKAPSLQRRPGAGAGRPGGDLRRRGRTPSRPIARSRRAVRPERREPGLPAGAAADRAGPAVPARPVRPRIRRAVRGVPAGPGPLGPGLPRWAAPAIISEPTPCAPSADGIPTMSPRTPTSAFAWPPGATGWTSSPALPSRPPRPR